MQPGKCNVSNTMRIIRFFLIYMILIASFANVFGQDASFSQFYVNPMYLNPALTGNTECGRLHLQYRNQWPSLNKAYVTYNVAYDQSLPGINSGFGFMVLRDQQGSGAYNRTIAGGLYSYKLQVSYNSFINFGVKAAFYQESIDWSKLIFADMINSSTGVVSFPGAEARPDKPTIYQADFAAGLVYGYSDMFFAGFAADHLTQPEMSFYENSGEKLHLRYTLHAGLNINASTGSFGDVREHEVLIQPNLLFLQQYTYSQISAGVYISKAPFVAGFWYKHAKDNADATSFLIGLKWDNYRIGYSYDYTVSKLSGKSGGAHELSFSWDFCIYTNAIRTIRTINSPTF